jgi:hypothetical protein
MAKRRAGVYQRKKKYADGTVAVLPTWWIKYSKNARVYRESSKSKVYADAERLLKRRMGEIVTGNFAGLQVERIQINQLFDDVVEDYKRNGRSSLVGTESRLKSFLDDAGYVRLKRELPDYLRPFLSSATTRALGWASFAIWNGIRLT